MRVSPNEIRTEPRPHCLVCGSAGKPLYQDLPSALFDIPGRWNFSQCPRNECGLVWINPTPIEADLHRAYECYFTHSSGDDLGDSGLNLRKVLYGAYRVVSYPGWLISGIARAKAQRAQMFLHKVNPGRLLDVGCGDGRFLNFMQQRGWTVDGIDFDPAAIARARQRYGLNLRHGDLRQAGLPGASFDAVTMSHVIEHVSDPLGLLVEIRRLLKVGGRLVITTPNIESIGHRRFGRFWYGVDAPRHLNLFSARNLGEVARRSGFPEVTPTSTSANADVFIGASLSLQENHQHRMGYQPTPSVLRTFKAACGQYHEHFRLWSDPSCGEELVVVCTNS